LATSPLRNGITSELPVRPSAFAVSLLAVGIALPATTGDSAALSLSISPKRALVSLAFVGGLARRPQ
jgi:hypothetical protein